MRVKEWRENAQPEWPEAASTTGDVSADGRVREQRATQVLAGGEARGTTRELPAPTEILRAIPRQSEGEGGARPADPAPRPAVDRAPRPAVRDPWEEPEDSDPSEPGGEHTHDPHEVTVQLDAVQLGDGFVRQVKEGTGSGAPADRPVFVDESGRRSRRLRRIGMAVALACGAYAVVIVATLMSGSSDAPWLPVPGQKDNPPAGQVDSPPLPEGSAPAGDTGATAPGGTPSTGGTTAPAPAPTAVIPEATAGAGRTGTSAKPSPTATGTTPRPGTGGGTAPTPAAPADPVTTPSTAATPTAEPTPEPTETTGAADDGGTGTVAEGPVADPLVTETPAAA